MVCYTPLLKYQGEMPLCILRVGHLQTCQLLQVMRQIIFTTMFQWCDYKHIPFPVSRGGLCWFPSQK